ncbi:putative transport system permease protein [Halobacteriovorax marinus SJ]|uniref:Transport system permease protein n=1 Tax=Halobacteriovorax marinus (strain ATCC BAA-682 / DSM 15412 / SJ) TaxID=862908 RepID=E1X1C8_HALMS|nr:branched-chain amino acid ABC transporter permease [Halobacteriovorax marinus]CBW26519.1 putative transport system permease protein [Halobacteriovorax marinus SJ]
MSEDTMYFFWDLGQYLLNGLTQGSIYALIALGYTMVYGIIKLINFAHGEFYMIGGFIGFYTIAAGVPLTLAFPIAMVGAGVIAVIIERIVYRPIRSAGRIPALITALGTSLFFQYTGQLVIGADAKAFPTAIKQHTWFVGELMISNIQVIILVSTFILMIFLWWLVNKTRIGKAMKATSYNHDAAELMGIDTNKIISFTFFVGAAMAGAAGVLVGMYYSTVEPMMGLIPGLKAFIAAVLGGIGIIPGAVIGGLTLGVAENLVVGFWESTYRDGIAFLILILILLVKPAGILGKNRKEKV